MALPKYERLRRELLGMCEELGPRALLPTERELAERFGLSRATVRSALSGLEQAGAVYRVQGAGTFVAPSTISKSLSLTSFSEDMRARGLRPGSRVLVADEVPAGRALAEHLRLRPADPVVRLVRVRLADDRPMCLETAYVPAARLPGLARGDTPASLYDLMHEHGLRPVRAEQVVEAALPGDEEAALLSMPPGAPALRIHRTAFDQRERPVERTISMYRADRYDIRFTVQRELP